MENLDPDVQDYTTDEDYNDVFDATTNGYVIKIFFHFSTPNAYCHIYDNFELKIIEKQLFKNNIISFYYNDPQLFLFSSFECINIQSI